MDTLFPNSNKYNLKGLRLKLIKAIIELWNNVIMVGTTEEMSIWIRRRTRLVNGISFVTVIVYAGIALSYTDSPHKTVFYESLVSMICYSLPILFNSYHKHITAIYFFNIYSTFVYTFYAISHGKVDSAEYLLLCSSVAAMLFFNSFKIILFFFLLNFTCFWICRYSFGVMKPFLFMPKGENFYVQNHTFTFFALFFVVYYFKIESIRQQKLLLNQRDELAREKRKSDELLLNILPEETANELMNTGTAKARSYDLVSVMFTDFKNFTSSTEKFTPQQLVSEVNYCYSAFDKIISKYNIEKIKTIGDSYMCAAGLPVENVTNAVDIVMAALEIQEFIKSLQSEKESKYEPFYELRLGIHTGPVVAGIVGIKKFAYDIWGDTVNIASCMESSGEVGKVNISAVTYNLIKDKFKCTYRGEIAAKHKGSMSMYFVDEKYKT